MLGGIMEVTVNKLAGSEVEITGELAAGEFAAYRPEAIKQLNQANNVPGFRPGHASEAALVAQLGEEKILLEMAELAFQKFYPTLVTEKKLDVLGRPAITITKLAKDNPLGFKIRTAIHPEFNLPDYRQLAKKANEKPLVAVTVEEKEVEEVLAELKKNPKFEAMPDLKDKVKADLLRSKGQKQKDKRRLEIIGAVVSQTTIDLPFILVEAELNKMVAEIRAQTEQFGLKFDDYLKQIKKEEKDLRAEWRADAERRVKTALVLAKISEVEKIGAHEAEVETEVKHLKEHYKDAPDERLRTYVVNSLVNEAVFRFLEEQK